MPVEFLPIDISIIENMMLTKSHKTIAEMIEKPVKETGELIESLCQQRELQSYQFFLDCKKAIRDRDKPKKVKAPKKKKGKKVEKAEQKLAREKKEIRAAIDQQRAGRDAQARRERSSRNEPKFETRRVDYGQKHLVRIDNKTFFYINPGEDEKAAREKFMKTYAKSFKAEEENPVPKDQKEKICRRCKQPKLLKFFYKNHKAHDARDETCIECKTEMAEISKRQKRYK